MYIILHRPGHHNHCPHHRLLPYQSDHKAAKDRSLYQAQSQWSLFTPSPITIGVGSQGCKRQKLISSTITVIIVHTIAYYHRSGITRLQKTEAYIKQYYHDHCSHHRLLPWESDNKAAKDRSLYQVQSPWSLFTPSPKIIKARSQDCNRRYQVKSFQSRLSSQRSAIERVLESPSIVRCLLKNRITRVIN